jgi:hypothetical protein
MRITLMLLLYSVCFGQSIPSVQKCRADQELWLSNLEPANPVYDDDPRLPTWDREDRQYDEMQKCRAADPEHRSRYDQVANEIIADRTIRIGRFLRRHDRINQFNRENPTLRADSPKTDRAAQMTAFLHRHHLIAKFKSEDTAIHKHGLLVK